MCYCCLKCVRDGLDGGCADFDLCFGASKRSSLKPDSRAALAMHSADGTFIARQEVCKTLNLNCISVIAARLIVGLSLRTRETVSWAFISIFVKMMAKRKRRSPHKAAPTTGNKQQKVTKGVLRGASARPPPGVTKAAKGRAVSGAKRVGGRYYPCDRHGSICMTPPVCLTLCATLQAQQGCCSQASEKASTR